MEKNISNDIIVGQIGGYASNPAGSVNTWWIETGEGLVLIDAQRAIHEAKLAVAAIKKTGRPVIAVLITHSHSDHIGGLPTFREEFGEDLPIYASPVTINMLEEDPTGDIFFTQLYMGPDFPDEMVIPNRILEDGKTLTFGKIEIKVQLFGPGEDHGTSVFYIPETKALFIGDIASNKMTSYLIDAKTGPWLEQIDQLKKIYPSDALIYPGHGEAGGVEILNGTAAYINLVRDAVKSKGNASKPLTDKEIYELTGMLAEKYPPDFSEKGWPPVAALPNLIKLNVEAVAHELGRLPGKAPTLGDMAK